VDDHEVTLRPNGGGLAHRCAAAAVVGGGLGLVWLAVMGTASLDGAISHAELGGLAIALVGLPAGALLAWPLLWAVGVGRAWLVALLAPVPVVATWVLLDMAWTDVDGRFAALPMLVLMAGGYAAAALATAPGLRWRWAVAAAMAVVVVLDVVLSGQLLYWRVNHQLDDQLRAFGHPLYAPDLPGFQVVNVNATLGADLMFSYQLRSTDAHGQPVEIRVEQITAPPGFTPPADCRAVLTDRASGPVPCAQVAPEVWSVRQTGYPVDVARRGDQVIRLTAIGDVSDAELLKAASSLRERPPDYFHPFHTI
jgi:hypothetical protein